MHNNKKNEEFQSRREFFKKAAKGALPILGALVLAGTPQIIYAAQNPPMGCSGGTCKGGCSGGCDGTCKYHCQGTCKSICSDNCSGTCKAACRNACHRNEYQ